MIRHSGYANLAVKEVLDHSGLSTLDAAFVTELVFGVCRHQGSLDLVIERAAGRPLASLQPAVVDILRLGTEQLLKMRTPAHAAVSSSVALAGEQIGRRVTGVVNAILRRVAVHDWPQWVGQLSAGMDSRQAMAIRTCHPAWIVEAYETVLPPCEVEVALEANNLAPIPTLVARPGLLSRAELLADGGEPTPYSPWGVIRRGDPGQLEVVRFGLAGVQDEGSQLVSAVLARANAPRGVWLDMCAGPGGKAALLTGLAHQQGEEVVAAEKHPHRAQLVRDALRGYGNSAVVVADGRQAPWGASFARVLVDAPCTGLGALRRRPEARWRKSEADLAELFTLQSDLLAAGWSSLVPGGVLAYVTCSPHLAETVRVIDHLEGPKEILDAPALLPEVPRAASGLDSRFIQLWPQRHHTDAMFCAVLRKP